MGLKRKVKNRVGNILIFMGIIFVAFSAFQIFKWRMYQNEAVLNLLGKEDIPVMELTAGEEKKNKLQEISLEETKILIPAIKVNALVRGGTNKEELKKGPGIYEKSPMPSQEGGNVCIAGHRTTYGAWFRNVDKLREGDEVILEYQGNKYIYKVERVFVVEKNDWSVTKPTGYSAITLTSCHPLRSSKQRIVVRGRLERVEKNTI